MKINYINEKLNTEKGVSNVVNDSVSSNSFLNILNKSSVVTVYIIITFIFLGFSKYTFEYYELFKNTVLILGVSFLFGIWVLRSIIIKKFEFVRTPLDLPIGIFLVSQIFASALSINTQTSIWGYYSRITGGLLSSVTLIFFFYSFVNNPFLRKRFASIILFSVWIVFGLGMITIFNAFGVFDGFLEQLAGDHPSLSFLESSSFTPVGTTNNLVYLLAIFLPIAAINIVNTKEKKLLKLILNFLIYTIILFAFFVSSTILPNFQFYFTFIIACVSLLGILFYSVKFKKGINLYFIVPIIILFLVSIGIFLVDRENKVTNAIDIEGFYEVPFDMSWSVITESFKENGVKGFVFGSGPDTYYYLFQKNRPLEYNNTDIWRQSFTYAPTTVLNYLVTSGLFGLIGFVSFVFGSLYFIFKYLNRNNNVFSRKYAFGIITTFIILSASSLFIFFNIALGFLMFLIIALLVSFYIKNNPREVAKFNISLQISKVKVAVENEVDVLKYIGIVLSLFIVILPSFLAIRNYVAEAKYKSSLNAASYGNLEHARDEITAAININNHRDYYHRHFAHVGQLALRDNLANLKDSDLKNAALSNNEWIINTEIEKSIKLNPKSAKNYENAMMIYRELIDLTEGKAYGAKTMEMALRAIEYNSINPDNFIVLGYLYKYSEEEELRTKAEEIYLHALSLRVDYLPSILALGKYYEFVDQKEKAIEIYEISQKAFPENSEIRTYLSEEIEKLQENDLEF